VRFLRNDSAYGVLEYSLILGLIAMLGIAALLMLGGNTDTSLRRSVSNFPSDNPEVSPTF
jgi:Flp pilus assembly pilin Flp